MSLVKVSIYIPAFNAEKTIKKTIISVKNQSYKFDEIIIIDDNSNDSTNKILKEFKDIKIIKNETNRGLGYNRNLGIKLSQNDIVASIDADVVLDPKWLEIMIQNFEKNNETMFGGKMTEKLLINKFNKWRAKYYSQNWGDKSFENPPFLYGCNTIQHKSVWDTVKGYDESLNTNGEDIDYSNKIKGYQHLKMRYCSDALAKHLQDDDINTLCNRVWRYHSFGYKTKRPSFYRTFKLSLKQIKFFFQRSFQNLIKFEFNFISINFAILIKFIVLEHIYYKKSRK